MTTTQQNAHRARVSKEKELLGVYKGKSGKPYVRPWVERNIWNRLTQAQRNTHKKKLAEQRGVPYLPSKKFTTARPLRPGFINA